MRVIWQNFLRLYAFAGIGACVSVGTDAVRQTPNAPVSSARETPRVRVLAVGDVMIHERVVQSAKRLGTPENHGYGRLLKALLPEIRGSDLAFANLETPVAKKEYQARRPFVFNASPELPRALSWAGFDLLSVANNHSLDQGKRGLLETIEFLRGLSMPFVGAGRNQAEAQAGIVMERRGLKLGFIGFTIIDGSTWRKALKPEKVWLNVNDTDEEIVRIIAELRERSDVVVVSIHWGTEYDRQPRAWQRELAAKMHAAGADVILGHHPHVLQAVESSTVNGREVITAYSLGNFLSNQGRKMRWPLPPKANAKVVDKLLEDGRPRDSVLLKFELTARGATRAEVIPLWTLNPPGAAAIEVVPIADRAQQINEEWKKLQAREKNPNRLLTSLKKNLEEIELLQQRLQIIRRDLGSVRISGAPETHLEAARKSLQLAQKALLAAKVVPNRVPKASTTPRSKMPNP